MRTKTFITILSVFTVFALFSCNQTVRDQTGYRDSKKWGKVITEEIDLKDFTIIEDNSCIDIVVNQGDEYKITLEGNEKALNQYDFYIEENETDGSRKLVCDNAKSFNFQTPSVRIYITAPYIDSFCMNGTGDLDIKDSINYSNRKTTTFVLNGSGDIDIRYIACNNLNLNIINGTGDISMKHLSCNSLNTNIKGSGDINIRNAKCINANFNSLGTGDLEGSVFATNNIFAKTYGSGDIELDVECKFLSINSQGTGDIEIEGTTETLKRYKNALGSTTTKKLSAKKMIWGD